MDALNIRAEYRKAFPNSKFEPKEDDLIRWADAKVTYDGWVKDDGDYYTREEWDAEGDPVFTITEHTDDISQRQGAPWYVTADLPDWSGDLTWGHFPTREEAEAFVAAVQDEPEPDTDCHCGHPECGAC